VTVGRMMGKKRWYLGRMMGEVDDAEVERPFSGSWADAGGRRPADGSWADYGRADDAEGG
jgi:hypothetical protein